MVNGKEMTIPFFEDLLRQADAPKVNIRVNPNAKTAHLTAIVDICKKHAIATVNVQPNP
jgi:hypothetical protein